MAKPKDSPSAHSGRPPRPDSPFEPPTKLDYAVLYGGPIAFLVVAVLGLSWLLGPAPRPNPVEEIRRGNVRVGMTFLQVEKRLGQPNEIVELPDGAFEYTYRRTSVEDLRRSGGFTQDEGIVTFDANGRVVRVRFDKIDAIPPDQQR
ncbi:MAG: hypothetical protein SNJ74_10775 [Fimbriimonadaceae bacterium]